MNEQAKHDTFQPSPAQVSLLRCDPFSASRLRMQLSIDDLLRRLVVLALIVTVVMNMFMAQQSMFSGALLIAAVIAWMALGMSSTRVARELPQLGLLLEHDPMLAEHQIAMLLRTRALQRWVRLSLYHRLAMLRHRQHRFDEVAAICFEVLSHPLGPAARARPHLLLMLAESRLIAGDLQGAYGALAAMHHEKRTLIESLQLLALQTRYEVTAGHYASVLQRVGQKISLAELMPAQQCGAMHAMIGVAAAQQGRTRLADWLRKRSQLLCTPEQLSAIWQQTLDPLPEPELIDE